MKTASEMKRRLDYLQETEAAQKRVERAYMLNWIIDSVCDVSLLFYYLTVSNKY